MSPTPSSDQATTTTTTTTYLHTLLDSARPFLRGELENIDPKLPSLVAVLRSVGAGECWHKHGSFLDHLVDIYRILKLWGVCDAVCLCGLFHSAYSNSYVNLAIFDPSTGRDTVRAYVGDKAESLIHLFCIVPRQPLIHEQLIFQYSDSELVQHLKASESSLRDIKENGLLSSSGKNNPSKDEKWRQKINSLVPEDGLVVKHIKTGEDIRVSRRIISIFVLMTIADFSDQLFNFQDVLFDNADGKLEFSGNNVQSLWPGNGKPGLWLHSLSKMAAVYMLLVREEEIMIHERKMKMKKADDEITEVLKSRDEDIELIVPPVFENCTAVLNSEDQIEARDLYWEAVCEYEKIGLEKAEEFLLKSIEKNPFVGEPHVVLSQLYLGKERFEEAEREAERGLVLLLEWGSPWDKRMSWEGWIAWARVLLMKSKENSWPQTSWGILNLGLVK
ncbi:hypothetical protein SOVF_180820 [Spinacia oleracea]|uniref:DUF6817 domain-containing protein n=1 Tax=Spinacia oleracea TaxID=3562 RepID=A0A9R0K5R8_SPIOL|nr:uncharacterized protein LOC110797734 [Spinacia oleracea]KNA06461.1 hypothetical protein SOVF_180820 [Spinacia oleracea]